MIYTITVLLVHREKLLWCSDMLVKITIQRERERFYPWYIPLWEGLVVLDKDHYIQLYEAPLMFWHPNFITNWAYVSYNYCTILYLLLNCHSAMISCINRKLSPKNGTEKWYRKMSQKNGTENYHLVYYDAKKWWLIEILRI